jgi:hypothetical protein
MKECGFLKIFPKIESICRLWKLKIKIKPAISALRFYGNTDLTDTTDLHGFILLKSVVFEKKNPC